MNFITPEYKTFLTQKKIVKVFLIIFIIALLIIVINGSRYALVLSDLNKLNFNEQEVANVSKDISELEENIEKVREEVLIFEEKIEKAQRIGFNYSENFKTNTILDNIRKATNDGIKVHSVIFENNLLEVSGAGNNIEEVAAFVSNLKKVYDVDIKQTQEINHKTVGKRQTFVINIKGGDIE